MRSQKEPQFPRLRRPATGWVLLVLLWSLGQALALGHRVGDGAADHHAHAIGGEHEEGGAQCRLIDQAGLAEALASAVVHAPLLPSPWQAHPALVPMALGAAPWPAYEARAPPIA